jgi:oxygen-dependent protoporphyrinogen oxidase
VPQRVAVVGGGISGLAAAHRLLELDPTIELSLLEAGPRLGGVLETSRRDGFLLEAAADNFMTTPSAALDLCHRLGLDRDLIAPDEHRRQALVVNRGRLLPVPQGFILMAPSRLGPMVRTKTLSMAGKLRAAMEYFLPSRADSTVDESLHSFVTRRFGREVFERLVEPLIGSIYTADPRRLSVEATFPRFRQMEREHGSLLRAMWRQRKPSGQRAARAGQRSAERASGARYGQFVSLRGGIGTLVEALWQRLPEGTVRLNSPVIGLQRVAGHTWRLSTGGPEPDFLEVDGVILATPAHHSAGLLAPVDAELAAELAAIDSSSCAVVALGYQRDQIGDDLNGFGFVVPACEEKLILSCSYSSVKYAGRAPDDAVLFRVFVGGTRQGHLLAWDDHRLVELAAQQLAELLQIRGEPVLSQVTRQDRAMPQYHVGHIQRLERIDSRLRSLPGVALASNALRGVGLPACIQSGEAAAAAVVAQGKDQERRSGLSCSVSL